MKFVAFTCTEKLTEKPSELPYLGLEHIEAQTGRLLLDTPVDSVESTVGVFKRGDVLFGKLRPYLAKVVVAEFDGVCTTELLALRPAHTTLSKFLFYHMLSGGFIKLVNSFTYGSKMPRANVEQISNVFVSLPPLPEQHSIAAFLDRETARVDLLIAKQQEMIEWLQEKRRALISHAVTRGLNPEVLLQESGVEWLGMVPEHWEVKRLKFAATLESGHTPSRSVPEYWEDCTIPWVSLADVGYLRDHDYIFETTHQINELGIANSSARILPQDTVVLSRDATVGRCAILGQPMATSQHFVNWVCHDELLPPYLLAVFKGPMQYEFLRFTMGATLRTIGMPDVNTFCVPIPPTSEQQAIVDYLNNETAKIDTLIAKA